MEIIATVNRRGGVGKTATAQAIGAGLAHMGKKVLFIDLDSQQNLTFDLAAELKPGSMELLTGTPAEDVIQHCSKWDIIPASPELAAADLTLTQTGKEYRLQEALEPIKGNYDYIIIDTPPALNIITVNALTAADSVLIPAQAEIHSLQGIALLYDIIDRVKKYCNKDLRIKGIILTRYKGRAILSQDMKEELEARAGQLGTKVFKTPVRECIAISEAQASQTDIFTYAPGSNAAKDYAAVLAEMLKQPAEKVYIKITQNSKKRTK